MISLKEYYWRREKDVQRFFDLYNHSLSDTPDFTFGTVVVRPDNVAEGVQLVRRAFVQGISDWITRTDPQKNYGREYDFILPELGTILQKTYEAGYKAVKQSVYNDLCDVISELGMADKFGVIR